MTTPAKPTNGRYYSSGRNAMKYVIKSSEGYLHSLDSSFGPTWVNNTVQRGVYDRPRAVELCKQLRASCYVIKFKLVRLVTKSDRVVREIERFCAEWPEAEEQLSQYGLGRRDAMREVLQVLKA